MPTCDEILTILREQRPRLNQRHPLQQLALFGSWARDEAQENSDVDVLVEVDPSIEDFMIYLPRYPNCHRRMLIVRWQSC